MASENVSQTEILRKNISAISEMQRRDVAARNPQERISDSITRFSGSTLFVFLHVIWFGLWILLNIGLVHIPRVSGFDPFPFGLLTMIVSLEAIFLSTFVLISQNRLAAASEKRAELDLQVNLLAEQESTKTLELLQLVAKKIGIECEDEETTAALLEPTDPELLIKEIIEVSDATNMHQAVRKLSK